MIMDSSKYTKINTKNEEVPVEVNKRRYWIVSGITAVLLGIAGFTMIVFGFMYAVTLSNESNVQTMAFLGIATAILILYFFILLCNKVIFKFFLRFSPLPKIYQTISILIAWGIIGLIYLLLSII